MKRKQLARIDLSNPDKPKIIFNAGIKAFNNDLRGFKNQSKVWIQIESYSPIRSLEQNKLFHLWVNILAEEIGIDAEDMKYLIKEKFLKVPLTDKHGNEILDEDGVVQFKVKNTSELSKAEFSELMDKLYRWGIDFFNCVLPSANEQQAIDYPTIER